MNAGIVILEDGTPCIFYDEELPHPIHHVSFSLADHQLTLVYDTPTLSKFDQQGKKLEFPLDARFAALLQERQTVAAALIKEGKQKDIALYIVEFTEK